MIAHGTNAPPKPTGSPQRPSAGNAPSATMTGHPQSSVAPAASNPSVGPGTGHPAAPSVAPAAGHGSAAPATGHPQASAAPVTSAPLVPKTASLVGTVLSDRYRIHSKLGEGGMGSVYLAEHTTINKKLAIKVLSSEYSHKQDLVDRFLQEARAASMIEQQNVVEITDFGSTPGGSVYFVMEFLNGEDLSKTIKTNGPLPWPRVKAIMLQICTALTAAHEVGIIHRDMKPENCYRIKRGNNEDFIKVLDFGIAKVTTEDGEGARGLTRTGMIFGTPEYMSPEQAKGEKVDHRVDVYAVGVILYELLTGRVPFTADTFMGILTKHMFEAPPAPSTVVPGSSIPPQVEAIILKALQKDREYRFQSMADLADAIESVGTDAAAVSVVAENVARPTGGETRFSSTGVPVVGATAVGRRKSGAGVFIGVAAFVLALGGAVGVYVWRSKADTKPDTKAATANPSTDNKSGTKPKTPPTKAIAGVVPPEDTKVVPPVDDGSASDDGTAEAVPTTVAITVSVPGVDGEVLDAEGNALGKTNEAFVLPTGEQSVELLVRASGFNELRIPVVPDAEKTVPAELTKARRGGGRKGGGRKGGGRKGGGQQDSGGGSTPAATGGGTTPPTHDKGGGTKPDKGGGTKPDKGGDNGSPDLKDPFQKH